MFSSLSRRWCSLLASLLLVFMDLMPLSAAGITDKFSISVKADCLSCAIAEQFPGLHEQLQGQVPWTENIQYFGKRRVTGFTVAATANVQAPAGLKPVEEQAWIAMAERGQMQLFLPRNYSDPTVVEQGTVWVEVQPLGAQLAKAERQGKTLVYKNAYPNTDSLQVAKAGRSEEFLYLRNKTAPTVFDYQVRVGKGIQVRLEGGSVAFVDSQGKGVRIERPWLVDSNGQRSESAIHWQVLEGGKHLRLVVEPQGLRYPLVVDPSWATTGSMIGDRARHTATLLTNGKVLIAGGASNTNRLNSAELYDPQTGNWTITGSLATARSAHTATLLPNGKVLVTGGLNTDSNRTTSPLSSTELYDPQTGNWTTTGSLGGGRHSHTATLLPNGKVLVAGGAAYFPVNGSELYDPQTGTWTATGSLSTARRFHTATLLPNGKVLVTGGESSDMRRSTITLSSAELYNPQTGNWTTTGSLATTRVNHTATLLPNGLVLAVGGNSSSELYDPQTGTWTTTGPLSMARVDHTAALLPNGTVLVSGGYNNGRSTLDSAELYDPQAGIWTTTVSLSTARSFHTATLLPNGAILAVGGEANLASGGSLNFVALSSAELYGLSTPTITSFSPMSTNVGSIVTLTGSGFTGVTSVTVNGQSTSFGFISDNQLNLQVSSGATSGPITVTTPAGSATSPTSLIVLGNPPMITSFSPTSGPVGTTVTINGANFTGTTSVKFRTTAAIFTVLSSSKIQAVVPVGVKSGIIVVTTPNGLNTSPTKFTVTP
jgi:Galactose oxidase, central domain